MQKQTKQITEYILDEEEFKTFKRALQYCLHRVKEHKSKGAESVGSESYLWKLIQKTKWNNSLK